MQSRHKDRNKYFQELATTSREFYIPYLSPWIVIDNKTKVLEIGCGEGGNLLPFAEMQASVKGLDISELRISQARSFFTELRTEATFECQDFLDAPIPNNEEECFDLILLHDVIEHIEPEDKQAFMEKLSKFVSQKGLIFVGFPAWRMPFGGHQQICHHPIPAHLPYTHLLPTKLYRRYLHLFQESEQCVEELMSIKRAKTSSQLFERMCSENDLKIIDRVFWFINPHYKVKFGLKPIRLPKLFAKMNGIWDFMTTSCFYLLQKK